MEPQTTNSRIESSTSHLVNKFDTSKPTNNFVDLMSSNRLQTRLKALTDVTTQARQITSSNVDNNARHLAIERGSTATTELSNTGLLVSVVSALRFLGDEFIEKSKRLLDNGEPGTEQLGDAALIIGTKKPTKEEIKKR